MGGAVISCGAKVLARVVTSFFRSFWEGTIREMGHGWSEMTFHGLDFAYQASVFGFLDHCSSN